LLAKQPADRYSTPAELALALRPFVRSGALAEFAQAPTKPQADDAAKSPGSRTADSFSRQTKATTTESVRPADADTNVERRRAAQRSPDSISLSDASDKARHAGNQSRAIARPLPKKFKPNVPWLVALIACGSLAAAGLVAGIIIIIK